MKKRKEKKEKRERQHRVHRRAGPGWCACMCVCGVGAVRVGLQCDGQKHLRCSTLRQPEDRNSNSCRDARLQRCTPSDPSDGLPAPATGPVIRPTEMANGDGRGPNGAAPSMHGSMTSKRTGIWPHPSIGRPVARRRAIHRHPKPSPQPVNQRRRYSSLAVNRHRSAQLSSPAVNPQPAGRGPMRADTDPVVVRA